MNILESFYLWQLDTGFMPGSSPKAVKLRFMGWLKLAPAYSLFMGAALWFLPVLVAALICLAAGPGMARSNATLFFWSFDRYVRYFGLPAITLGFLLSLPQMWAWNRRANRLVHMASLPQPALAIDPGVWPPPPDVPEGR